MELAKQILKRLKFDNDTIRKATVLIQWHDCRMNADAKVIRRIMSKVTPELFEKLLDVQYADTMAQSTGEKKSWSGSKKCGRPVKRSWRKSSASVRKT